MAELVSVFTDLSEQPVGNNESYIGQEIELDEGQFLMVVLSFCSNDQLNGTTQTLYVDGEETPRSILNGPGDANINVMLFGFYAPLGGGSRTIEVQQANGPGITTSYKGQYLVWDGVLEADAGMNTAGNVQVEFASPLEIAIEPPSLNCTLVAIGSTQSLSLNPQAGTFEPSSLNANAQELLVNTSGIEGIRQTVSVAFLQGVSSAEAVQFAQDTEAEGSWLLDGFVFTAPPGGAPAPGASATNFNCECECGPANKTLAAYRRDLLIRCGFAAIANNPPPGTTELMDAFLRDAQEFLYKKYPALHTKRFFRWTMTEGQRFYGIMENDDSTQPRIPVSFAEGTANAVEVTWGGYAAPPANRGIFFTAAEGNALPYGMLPNTMYFVVNAAAGVSNLALIPSGTPITITLGSDTEGVSHGYAEIRQAIFNLEPYADIEGAWLVDLNGSWLPMTCGIPPTFYTTVSQPGLPVRYEIRSCIEVFPAPAAAYSLYIKGHFGLRPFELDSDKPTIDGHLVYLWALANALDYYGKPSAAGIATQAQDYLGQLVAGTHTGKRYVPGMRPLPPAIIPIFAPWPGGDP